MKFKVKYLDKDALEKDIYDYNNSTIHQNRLVSPKDSSWADYFRISKEIESDSYRVAYYEDNSNKGLGRVSLGNDYFLVIEANGELIFVDSYALIRIWSQEGQLPDGTFLERMDGIFKKGITTENCYSWDSAIERIKILNIHKDYKWLEIDKVITRENKINQLLK